MSDVTILIKDKKKTLAEVEFDGKKYVLDTKNKLVKESFSRPQYVGVEDMTLITEPLKKLNSILRSLADDYNYKISIKSITKEVSEMREKYNRDTKGQFATVDSLGSGRTSYKDKKMSNKEFIEYANSQKNIRNDENRLDILLYRGKYSWELNKKLQSGKLNKRDKEMVATIDKAMINKLEENTYLYRGMALSESVNVGDVISTKGYSATSFSKQRATNYTLSEANEDKLNRYLIKIPAEKGTVGMLPASTNQVYYGDQEFVLPRGASFKIKSITPEKGTVEDIKMVKGEIRPDWVLTNTKVSYNLLEIEYEK